MAMDEHPYPVVYGCPYNCDGIVGMMAMIKTSQVLILGGICFKCKKHVAIYYEHKAQESMVNYYGKWGIHTSEDAMDLISPLVNELLRRVAGYKSLTKEEVNHFAEELKDNDHIWDELEDDSEE